MLYHTLNLVTDEAQRDILWNSRYSMHEDPASTIPAWYGEQLFYSGGEAIATYLDATAQGHRMSLQLHSVDKGIIELEAQSVALLTIMWVQSGEREARKAGLREAKAAIGLLLQ